jgi:hypothetical protein
MIMKKLTVFTIAALFLTLSSCQVVEGIFKAGVWVGILIVVAIIALVIFLFSKMAGK